MEDGRDAEDAVKGADGFMLDGRNLKVEIASGGGGPRRDAPRGGDRGGSRNPGVCYDWQAGKCQRGDSCRFTHSDDAPRGAGGGGRDDRGGGGGGRDDYRRDDRGGGGRDDYRRDDRGGGRDDRGGGGRDDYRRDDRGGGRDDRGGGGRDDYRRDDRGGDRDRDRDRR
jgi:hypothetical protein